MPACQRLAEAEKSQIEAHRSQNMSCSEIARAIGRHRTTISNSL